MTQDPFRLRVQKALVQALESINPAAGYVHDLEGKVFRGRTLFSEEDPIPLVSMLEDADQPEQQIPPRGADTVRSEWRLLIQGWVEDDYQNPTDPAHGLLAEVKKRLVLERRRAARNNEILDLDGRVDDITFDQGVVRPPDEISGKAYFWLRVTVGLVENLHDPYA